MRDPALDGGASCVLEFLILPPGKNDWERLQVSGGLDEHSGMVRDGRGRQEPSVK